MADVSEARSGQFTASGLQEIQIRSLFASSNKLDSSGNVKMQKEEEKPGWRKFIAHVGPGFLVSIAYIDPGNLETDLQAGAQYKYELLWVILVASLFALLIQALAANLGVTTGKHLAEHFREEYPKNINYILWLLAETAVIAADIPEVLGTAFALNMLFHIPVWVGVLITGLSTLMILGLQRFGIRKLEGFVAFLVFIMFACFFGELAYAKPEAKEVVKGLFVPQLKGNGATGLAISLLGAMIMPHNLFLHSALVLSRKVTPSTSGINLACRYFFIETAVALIIAFMINVAITCVAGSICFSPNLPAEELQSCGNLDINSSAFLLKQVLGNWSSTVFAIALLASGQSSTITGTYAGQYVMQGFLNMKMKAWKRNLITRGIAILPSLIVSLIYGSSGAGKQIIIASTVVAAWSIGLCIIGINIYYLSTQFGKWLIHNSLPKVASVFIALVVFPLMAFYLAGILYLALRRDKKVTYIAPGELSTQSPSNPEQELQILATD
eukprot:PITA_01211